MNSTINLIKGIVKLIQLIQLDASLSKLDLLKAKLQFHKTCTVLYLTVPRLKKWRNQSSLCICIFSNTVEKKWMTSPKLMANKMQMTKSTKMRIFTSIVTRVTTKMLQTEYRWGYGKPGNKKKDGNNWLYLISEELRILNVWLYVRLSIWLPVRVPLPYHRLTKVFLENELIEYTCI